MATYVRVTQRRAQARAAARRLLATTRFHELTLRAVAEELGWPLGTLHRAYSVSTALLNDLVLEYEREAFMAVYAPGPGGLAAELAGRAERWHDWLADPAHVQLLRYQMDMVCREQSPLAQDVPHARTSSQHYQRALLDQIAAGAGEAYRDPDAVADVVAGLHDGLTYSFLEHRDRGRLRAELLSVVPLIEGLARPRRAARASSRARAAT